MEALSHNYLAEPVTGMKGYLQTQIVSLQKEMMDLRKSRNFDELEALERKVDHLHRRMRSLI